MLIVTTLVGGFLIREPPVRNPTTEKFKPWSAMKVAWKDPRTIVLMISVSLFQAYLIGLWKLGVAFCAEHAGDEPRGHGAGHGVGSAGFDFDDGVRLPGWWIISVPISCFLFYVDCWDCICRSCFRSTMHLH